MPNYQQAKIYKITSPSTNKIYIGSTTTKYLSTRLHEHKKQTRNHRQGRKNMITSELITSFGDSKIELIEKYPCNNRKELETRERYYMDLNSDIIVNKTRPITQTRFICECSGRYMYSHKNEHLRTKKHKKFLENN